MGRETHVPVINPTGPPPTIRTSVSVTVIARISDAGPSVLAFVRLLNFVWFSRDKLLRGMRLIAVTGLTAVSLGLAGKHYPIRSNPGISHRLLRRVRFAAHTLRVNCLSVCRSLGNGELPS